MSLEICAILDCGGQYTKVIDRKVRELGVRSEIFPININADELKNVNAIIISGGSVDETKEVFFDTNIFNLGLPMLGIGYGMRLINNHYGGRTNLNFGGEYGVANIKIEPKSPLFHGLEDIQAVLMNQSYDLTKLGDGFFSIAEDNGICTAIYNDDKKIAGVGFHPEVELTKNGNAMLENFLRRIAMLKEEYALEDRIEVSIKNIKEKAGDKKVIALVSGGVDSAVTAALLLRALPNENVFGIHIDHGLMRKDESDLICEDLKKQGLKNLLRVNAQDAFFNSRVEIADGVFAGPLSKEVDPEIKRQIIGRIFIDTTAKAAESLGINFDDAFLAQGTLRPDLIESGNPDVSVNANTIKTHHNDVDIIRKARAAGRVIETNWDWHKDEVRQVARLLGLDEKIASRQPFPGPGLGVRILCLDKSKEKDEDKISTKQENEYKDYLQNHGYGGGIAPIKSVGVQGDNRSYRSLGVIWGDELDADFEDLATLSAKVPNIFNTVNRCAYLLNAKTVAGDFATETLFINQETVDILRAADDIVTRNIQGENIAQCFAALLPMYCKIDGRNKGYSIVIRAVVTTDYMTANTAIPGKDFPLSGLKLAVEEIKSSLPEIDLVLFDTTGKPPATIEWE